MAVTLAQAKLNTLDDIQAGVIDEYRKSSYLLDNMTFDDAVTPGTAGATLTYGYQRTVTESTAAFRAINAEYTAAEATKQRYTVDLKPFGGTFQIDRVLEGTGGLVDEVTFQTEQKLKSTKATFHDTVINGDVASNANAFDGLGKALTGTSTEYNNAAVIDLSTSAAIDTNYKNFLDALDLFLALLDGAPSLLGMNSTMFAKMSAVARRAGYLTQAEDAFGRKVNKFGEIPFIDLGAKPSSASPIVGVFTRTVGTSQTGLTDIYAIRLGLDGFHGVSMHGKPLVQTWMPDFKTAGAVKTGEVEMVAAVALKATKAAGVFRNIKIQ